VGGHPAPAVSTSLALINPERGLLLFFFCFFGASKW
jgi:hypothetical protein